VTEHDVGERPPLNLPWRPSKRRRDMRNGLSNADERARAPARPPEPGRQAQHNYATAWQGRGGRFRLSSMVPVAVAIDICHRQPPSLEQAWVVHRQHAELWRTEHAPPPRPVAVAVDEWGPVDAWGELITAPAKAGQPAQPVRGPLGWPGRIRYVWAGPHLALTAVIYLLCWITERPACLQLAAAALALGRRGAWRQVLCGEPVWHRQPCSITQTWERHTRNARSLNAAVLRWPRFAWGVAHTALQAALYLLRWVSESAPRFLIFVLAVAVIIWTL
jgi:hypothetical protein